MGWDGMGFTLLRGWDGTLGKGRKRKRKRSNPIGEKRPTVPNRETEGLRRIRGAFPRFERGEFYRFGRRILKRFLSWGWIGFDSVLIHRHNPLFRMDWRGELVLFDSVKRGFDALH